MVKRFFKEIKHIVTLCLQVKNLGILLIVTIIDSFASGFLSPIFAPFLHEKGIDFTQIGYIFSIAAVLPLILQPIMGELSDRIGRKILMVGTKLTTSVMTPLYIFLDNVWAIGVLQATNVTLERSAAPASGAMLADVAPKNDRATVFASLDAINNIAYVASLFLCGGLLAGLSIAGYTLLDPISKGGLFWISAVLFILAALILTFFLKETAPIKTGDAVKQPTSPDKPATKPTIASHVRAYFGRSAAVFRQGRTIRGLILYRFFFTFALSVYTVWVPMLALRLGAPDSWLGPIVAISWFTYAVAQPIGGRVSDLMRSRKPLMFWGLIGLAICNTGLALSPMLIGGEQAASPGLALVVMLIFWALLGFPDAMSRPSASALLVDVVAPEHRGRVFGVIGSSATLASVLAPVSYGFLAEKVSLMAAFLLTSVCLAAAAIVVALMIEDPKPQQDEEPADAEQPAPSS